jgi:TonB-dependent SusC/RagA subfamily outer membrane receptor
MTSQSILLYLLKTILVSGILLAYYWIALRDKKFHYYNRFYLLSSSVLSLVVPLLNFDWFTVEEPALIYSSNELIQFVLPTTTANNGVHLDWADYVLITTGVITIALLGLLLFHIIKIQFLKNRSEVTKMDGFDFINTNEENAPFSFLNNLFWKQSISLQEEGGQQIFKHEITHIQQKHTWDRIYCQIIASIFWMNPFNWIIQKELVAIHEFIADEEAVGNTNVAAFAKMLLQTHYGNHFLNPTHSFFYSSIKRRLAMLTQTSNPKYSYLRRVMGLPVLVITISLVSIKVNAREKIENKVESIKNQIESLISDSTRPAIISIKADTVKSIKVVKGELSNVVNIDFKAIVDTIVPNKTPLYVLDGVPIKDFKGISPIEIESMNIMKDPSSISLYGDAGKNGVILITTKKGHVGNLQNKAEDLTVIAVTDKGTKDEVTAIFHAPKIQKNIDVSQNNDPIFYTAQKAAQFPGGGEGWIRYLERNLNRDVPVANGAPIGQYKVILSFVVTSDGDIKDVKAVADPGYGTAAEAIRIIEKGPKWVPAEQNGKKVNYFITQSIAFAVAAQ